MSNFKYIKWFKELSKNSIEEAGGKGANLGEMYNASLPVPPGFVITTLAYKVFLTEISNSIYAILDDLDVENTTALQNASKKIQELMLSTPIPNDIKNEILEAYSSLNIDEHVNEFMKSSSNSKALKSMIQTGRELPFVAVRSSASAEDLPSASFAGQQASFLNIKGFNHLIGAVKACWASLFTARAIYYRVKNKFPHKNVFIAAVVQKMVDSDKSGIIFSINPTTNDISEILIEAGFGLGEAIVSGSIIPDNYVIDKATGKLKSISVAKQEWAFIKDPLTGETSKKNLPEELQGKRKLSEKELSILWSLTTKIENHYKFPQDIEYAIEGEKVYIVQSRPVTTITQQEYQEKQERYKQEQYQIKQEATSKPQKAASEETKKLNEKKFSQTAKQPIISGIAASPGIGKGRVKIVHTLEDLKKIEKGDILVAKMTNPDYVAAMEKCSAIVTDVGGRTCHASIIGREMGKPVIVGTGNATQVLHEGMFVSINANEGKVYEGDINFLEEESSPLQAMPQEAMQIKSQEKAWETTPTITEIKVMLDIPDHAEEIAKKTNAQGVGLLRCEFMLASIKFHPVYLINQGREEELINEICKGTEKIAAAFPNHPIWYRTSDFRTDEYTELEGSQEQKEDNPMLGLHGIRKSLEFKPLFKAELKAIKQCHNDGYTNIGIMLPMITHSEQVSEAKKIIKEIFNSKDNQSKQKNRNSNLDIEFGIMIETPAACQIIEELCKEGIDFISFGTNDLTQFTLAVDRNNEKVQNLYDEMHPAILRQISHVIETCKKYNVKTSICGQAGSNPNMAEFLVKAGIDSITANPDAVHLIRETVSKIERKLLLEAARMKYYNK